MAGGLIVFKRGMLTPLCMDKNGSVSNWHTGKNPSVEAEKLLLTFQIFSEGMEGNTAGLLP